MTSATLNLRFSPRRMLSMHDAAEYCGLSPKSFRVDCRVSAVALPGGRIAYDMRDLDLWLDALKGGQPIDDDAIVDRLK